MKLIYPACFYLEEDGAYSVTVPDLSGCFTQGNNIEEAMQMAQDAALGWILTASEENEELPKSSNIQDIKLETMNSFTSLLLLDFKAYLQKYGSKKVVKKTITIPEWIDTKAKQNQINFSQTLQDALLYKIANKME